MVHLNTKTKLAIARSAYRPIACARRAFGAGDRARVRRNGLVWELDLGEAIEFTIYLLGAFERTTMRAYERILRPGDVALDIGAHIGSHALPMARCVGAEGRVIAIEPTASAFRKLVRNVDANPDIRDRLLPLQIQLVGPEDDASDTRDHQLFSSWPLRKAEGLHPVHRGRLASTEGAARETVDVLLQRLQIPKVHVVKMDIDGVECAVLAGARGLLEYHRPRCIMELMPYGLEEHGASLEELIDVFRSHRYTFLDLRGRMLPRDAGALCATIPPGGSRNVIAVPLPFVE